MTVSSNLHRQRGWVEPSFRLFFAASFISLVVLLDLGTQFYKILSAPAPSCDCWNPDGYWQNPAQSTGSHTYDADGARHTDGQPSGYAATIWLFGNSGTADPFVDDTHTMAAQLQARFTAARYNVRVVNHSAGGQLVSGELAWLKDSPVQHGDLVVFIDGSMDLMAKTPLDRYRTTLDKAQRYTRARGATFYHFVQPYIDPAWCCAAMGTPRLTVPPAEFVDSSHMNANGDARVAAAVFDALTLI